MRLSRLQFFTSVLSFGWFRLMCLALTVVSLPAIAQPQDNAQASNIPSDSEGPNASESGDETTSAPTGNADTDSYSDLPRTETGTDDYAETRADSLEHTGKDTASELEIDTATGDTDLDTETVPTEGATPYDAGIHIVLTEDEPLFGMSLEELLDTPITTASGGISESGKLSPATVTTITHNDIARNGWRSMREILSHVPGLYVIDNYVLPSISVRGVNGGLRAGTRIVKIMINSVPVNFRPELSASLGPEFIPVDAIEQVEIVKGPLSALYGANAFLATINVITKKAEPGLRHEAALRYNVQQSNGEPGYGGSLMTAYGGETVDVILAVTTDRFDRSGLAIQKTFEAQDRDPGRFPFLGEKSESDISRPVSGWMKVDLRLCKAAVISAQVGLQKLDAGGEYILNSIQTHENRVAINNLWSEISYTHQWTEKVDTELAYGNAHGRPADETRLVLPADQTYYRVPMYEYMAHNFRGSVRYDTGWLNIKAGGDFEHNTEQALWYKSSPFAPDTEPDPILPPDTTEYAILSGGFYTAIVGQPLAKEVPGLKLSGNIRLDRITYGDVTQPWQYSWRLASTYNHKDKWSAKIFGGRSFQGPSGVLMFAQPGLSGFGQDNNIIGQMILLERNLADDTLKPQVAKSIETAGSVRIRENVNLEASVFYQQIEDTISLVPYAGNFLAQNSGTSKFVGMEAALHAVFFDRFFPLLSGGYVRPVDWGQDESVEHVEIPLYPNWQLLGSLGVAIPEVHLHLNVLARYITARGATAGNTVENISRHYTLDPYGDIDATLSTTDLYLIGDNHETIITFSARNLIGKTYSEPGYGGFDYPSQGRTFLVELRQRF